MTFNGKKAVILAFFMSFFVIQNIESVDRSYTNQSQVLAAMDKKDINFLKKLLQDNNFEQEDMQLFWKHCFIKSDNYISYIDKYDSHNKRISHHKKYENNDAMIKVLLDYGCDINWRIDDSENNTALHFLIRLENLEMIDSLLSSIQFLLEKGIDVHVKDTHGRIALNWTSNSDIAGLLIPYMHTINDQDANGHTILHNQYFRIYDKRSYYYSESMYAFCDKNISIRDNDLFQKCLPLMLYHGADITIEDNQGMSLLDYIMQSIVKDFSAFNVIYLQIILYTLLDMVIDQQMQTISESHTAHVERALNKLVAYEVFKENLIWDTIFAAKRNVVIQMIPALEQEFCLRHKVEHTAVNVQSLKDRYLQALSSVEKMLQEKNNAYAEYKNSASGKAYDFFKRVHRKSAQAYYYKIKPRALDAAMGIACLAGLSVIGFTCAVVVQAVVKQGINISYGRQIYDIGSLNSILTPFEQQ